MNADINQGSTARLVDWVAQVSLDDLPAPVRDHALRSFVHIVGCMVGGARHEILDVLEKTLLPLAGPATSTLIGRGRSADMLLASMINCTSSGVLTFDDTHAQAIVHPSGPIASVVLALAQARPCSGAQALLSFAIGLEVICRLGKALAVPPAQGNMSWLQSAICAPVAVALAAGRMIGLPRQNLTWAVGIAAAYSSGRRGASGSSWSRVIPGEAAQMGLKAALLAEQGLTGGEAGIESEHGFAAAFSMRPHLAALDQELGQRYELLGNTFKPYPCGIVIHPVIDACFSLRGRLGVTPDRIDVIDVCVHPVALTLTDRPQPVDPIEAQVSVQHWVAMALIDGAAGMAQLDPARIVEPGVAALRARVRVAGDAAMPKSAALVSVTLRDGSTQAQRIDACVGSTARPMTDADITQKFLGLAAPVLGEQAAHRLLELCWRLPELVQAGQIADAARA